MRKIVSFFIALTLSAGLWAQETQNVNYIDADGQQQTVTAAVITNETSALNAGWYVVTGADVQTGTLTCNGAVHLILADGAKLTATGDDTGYTPGIQVSGDGASLAIYGQTAQSGQLEANGGYWAAGIGGGHNGSGSNITINGGIVTANGGNSAAGIGGGDRGSGSYITINGGVVTATGGIEAAGIGGGNDGAGLHITINGGVVTANGGDTGAGIGGGWASTVYYSGNYITITGGEVTATGGGMGAGIGGGFRGSCSNISIIGGKVTATGGMGVSGIGAGNNGTNSYSVEIATTLLVKADNNNPPTTVILNTGFNLADSLKGKQYVTTEPIVITYGEYITVSPEFESGANVAYGTDITFTAADRSAVVDDSYYEFLGFYKESTFDTPITEGVSGRTCTLTVTEAAMSVYAKYEQFTTTHYIDAGGQEQVAKAVEITSTTLNAGWYVVRGSNENHGALTCNGAVHLILADGAKLTANGSWGVPGITVSGEGNSLTIYGQTNQSGQLIANGGNNGAGIGGGNECSGSNITINGGIVTANGGSSGAGIGGGDGGSGSNITINGGKVIANAGADNSGAGIGGGYKGSGSNITINGGTVTAKGEVRGAGIGGGYNSYGSNITINGGTVTATGGANGGAGIGGGYSNSGSNITISGGTVTANGGWNAAGIGGGWLGSGSYITITGGTVTANGQGEASCIGRGKTSGGNTGSNIFVATGFIIRADNSNPPVTVVADDRTAETDIASVLDGRLYAIIWLPQPGIVTYGDYITVSPEFASGDRVAIGTEITFTADDRFADNYEFLGFYRESTFENKITQGVSGLTYTVTATEANISVYARYKEFTPTPYIDANGQEQSVKTTEITNETASLSAGWYVVAGEVSRGNITCNGEVHLILADGAILTATGGNNQAGITVSGDGNSLTIYGQTNQTGELIANGGKYGAGIGGEYKGSGSNITINGGKVTANGGENASGIGGGADGSASNIKVVAELPVRADNTLPPLVKITHTTSQDIANDLAGKRYVIVGNIEDRIVTYGDHITVSPEFESGDNVEYGTEITFTAADRRADNYLFFGFYKESTFDTPITQGVSGLTYTAMVFNDDISVYAKYEPFTPTSYIDADGQEKNIQTVEITDETTTLGAGWYAVRGADVKTGTLVCNGAVNLILTDGAKLTAAGGNNQAGITVSGDGNSLTVYGQAAQSGQLIANGGENGAGIGGGNGGNGSNITINGGEVMANGGENAAGIGGGNGGNGSNIRVAAVLTVYADNTNPPTTEILHADGYDIAINLAGRRYAVVKDDITGIKDSAIAAINAAIEGVTNEDIIDIATNAIAAINAAINQHEIEALKEQALAAIASAKAIYNSGLGEMGVPCEDCPSVEVTGQNDKTLKLYNPKSVKFKKE